MNTAALKSSTTASKPRFQISEKAIPLFKPAPYKIMHGGRGGCKSWDYARSLLVIGMNKPLFIVCGRDIQKSIKESVHKLLKDQIQLMGLEGFYDAKETEIVGINGTRFVFVGLRNNINNIKSMEAIDILWVAEANTVTGTTWVVLLPTVRRDPPFGPFGQGSEVWLEFNPELATDYTYKYFVVDPPEGAVVIECSYMDNPWFPEILRKQMEEMKRKNYDEYLTVWCGKTRKTLAGAIYAKELGAAIEQGRVTPGIKHIKGTPVIVVADLGKADMTSLWFLQQVQFSHLAIHHYSNTGEDWVHYLKYVQETGYQIGGIWLPHDSIQEHISAVKSVWGQTKAAYPTDGIVRRIPLVRIATRINLMRTLFPRLFINETECSNGLLSLQHYQFGVHPHTKQRTKDPLHNWASHDADSLGGYAVMLSEGNKPDNSDEVEDTRQSAETMSPHGWMR